MLHLLPCTVAPSGQLQIPPSIVRLAESLSQRHSHPSFASSSSSSSPQATVPGTVQPPSRRRQAPISMEQRGRGTTGQSTTAEQTAEDERQAPLPRLRRLVIKAGSTDVAITAQRLAEVCTIAAVPAVKHLCLLHLSSMALFHLTSASFTLLTLSSSCCRHRPCSRNRNRCCSLKLTRTSSWLYKWCTLRRKWCMPAVLPLPRGSCSRCE